MIRDFKTEDIDVLMPLWLDTNCAAHHFIGRTYWESHYATVQAMLPNATLYIYEEANVIQGFIGLIDNFIAGIFVAQGAQSKGIGKQLLDHVKQQQDTLSLSVYKANTRAIHFYLREQFTISTEQLDIPTGQVEYLMHWTK